MLKQVQQVGFAGRLIALSFLLWGVGEGLWLYIQPLFPEKLGANPQQVGLVMAMLGVGRAVGIIPTILLMRRYGPLPILFPGYFVGALGMFIAVFAQHWLLAAVAYLLYGLSYVTLIPVTLYLTQAAHSDPSLGEGVGLHTLMTFSWAANALGIIISPAIGGYLGEQFGLRAVFGLSGFWFTVASISVLFCPKFPDIERDPPTSTAYPVPLRQNQAYLRLNLLFVLVCVIAPLGFTLMPSYLESAQGYSTDRLGLLGTVAAIGMMVWSLVLGNRRADQGFGLGQMLGLAAFGLMLFASMPVMVIGGYFLYGAWFTLRPLVTSLITDVIRVRQRSFAFGLLEMLQALGGMIGPLLAGWLYVGGGLWPVIAALILGGLTLLMSLRWVRLRNVSPQIAYSGLDWPT